MGIKIPWQVFACTGVMLVLGLLGWKLYDLGQDHKQLEWDAAVERGRKAVEELKKKQVVVTTKIETKYLDRVKVIREKGDEILRQIPVYVPSDSCELPGGFRLLHDAAATNTLPNSAELPDAASVPAQDVASTVAGNYKTCHETIEQLASLQQWITQMQLLHHTQDSTNK